MSHHMVVVRVLLYGQRTLESVLSKKTMDGYDCRMLTKYNTAPKVQVGVFSDTCASLCTLKNSYVCYYCSSQRLLVLQ